MLRGTNFPRHIHVPPPKKESYLSYSRARFSSSQRSGRNRSASSPYMSLLRLKAQGAIPYFEVSETHEALCLSFLLPISVPPGRKNPHIVFPSGGTTRRKGCPAIG